MFTRCCQAKHQNFFIYLFMYLWRLCNLCQILCFPYESRTKQVLSFGTELLVWGWGEAVCRIAQWPECLGPANDQGNLNILGCPVKAGSTFTGLLRTWQTRSLSLSTFAVSIRYCSLLEAEISTQWPAVLKWSTNVSLSTGWFLHIL